MYNDFLYFILLIGVRGGKTLKFKEMDERMNIFPRLLFLLFRFARLAANTFISQGVPVYLFSDVTPTPFVVCFSIKSFFIHANSVRYQKIILRKSRQNILSCLSSGCLDCLLYAYVARFDLQHP